MSLPQLHLEIRYRFTIASNVITNIPVTNRKEILRKYSLLSFVTACINVPQFFKTATILSFRFYCFELVGELLQVCYPLQHVTVLH